MKNLLRAAGNLSLASIMAVLLLSLAFIGLVQLLAYAFRLF